jgi:thiamine-phosphate pyrophosphorylase
VDIVHKVDACGVHLGLQDMPIRQARHILGNEKIIGGTANTLEDVLMRVKEECDYIGLGPFRFTSSKKNLSPILGVDGINRIMQELASRSIQIPVYAIGGITFSDVEKIIETGVAGIALSSEITMHPNKKELLENFNQLFNGQINHS